MTMLLFQKITLALLFIFVLICFAVYFIQEKLIFHPNSLDLKHKFQFSNQFEELFLPVTKDVKINCLHFKAMGERKGLIFYLHGNAANLQDWGETAPLFTDLGYDVLMMDYRGYGKSNGKINSQQQFYTDAQKVYDYAKKQVDESQIIIAAFSIGTGTAAYLAAQNKPQKLILQAPYYSLKYLINSKHPYLPSFLLKYQFKSYDFLKKITCSITIFHGEEDSLIPIQNSLLLKEEIPKIDLIKIPNCNHNDIPNQPIYQKKIKVILS